MGGGGGRVNSSQLLLVITDGRGLFLEGVDAVRRVVLRYVYDARVFLVLIVLDGDPVAAVPSMPADAGAVRSTGDASRAAGQSSKAARTSILDIKVC